MRAIRPAGVPRSAAYFTLNTLLNVQSGASISARTISVVARFTPRFSQFSPP